MVGCDGHSIWDINCHEWVESKAIGLSGGLFCSWDSTSYRLLSSYSSRYWLWCKLESKDDGRIFHIINVYGPNDTHGKSYL